ncbi:hypothetical protein NLG97_g5736 [Lecanicillium saksenae]|uniref:Uncharacterized protein n=1 Tax=Lecanicillium saksenae TaxID=468837 RepID=A0ACC1QU04_9HYPO|nr:hypothetical protein NLG97_g5736 [Lecanicillium saksenae]
MKLPFLALGIVASRADAAAKGNTEVDVMFPYNGTFAPTPLLPIVFAIQNPEVAQKLNLRLNYRVIPYGHPNVTTDYERVRLNALPNGEATFYARDFVSGIFNKEGTWEFFWQLRWNNCTSTEDGDGKHFSRDTEEPVNSFVFSTHRDGRKPDLVASNSSDDCKHFQGIAFEVQGLLDVPPPQNADMLTSCAHVAVPAPTPSPCRASIPSDAIESISSRITKAACLVATPVVSCPAQDSASGRTAVSAAAVAWSLGLVVYAVIH